MRLGILINIMLVSRYAKFSIILRKERSVEFSIVLALPILAVTAGLVYILWALKQRHKSKVKKEIQKSGVKGELKVQSVLRVFEKPGSRYKVYHNVKLGPDVEHTNEYDTIIVGPNGIFHIETKNYGGERGGIIDVDSRDNWILHKKSGYSKIITNPAGQVNSHEYRLNGFLRKVAGLRDIPTRGIIVLSCDDVTVRYNQKGAENPEIPVLHRHELVEYITNYNRGKVVLNPRVIKKICSGIESMNRYPVAN